MIEVVVHTDGASRGNPGPSAIAYIIAGIGESKIEFAKKIGETTNNQAEYQAMRYALEDVVSKVGNTPIFLQCYSDSELMVKQLNGEYRVRDLFLKPHFDAINNALKIIRKNKGLIQFIAVRREHNKRADELANLVLDNRWQTD